jgi:hypothetical protein
VSIHRYTRTKDFTIIGNDCLRDDTLSAESLGVLCYLRGKPDDWKVMPTELAGRFKCGRDRIGRILKELIGHGYIKKVRPRDPVTKAWLPVEFAVFDTRSEPLPENTFMATDDEPPPENPSMAPEPLTENPSMENPSLGFATLLNTELPNTESNQKNLVRSKRTKPTDAEIDQVFEERFWPAYPKRAGPRGKPEAKKKFRTIIKTSAHPANDMEKIIDAATKFATDWAPKIARKPDEAQYILMAATWLNKRRWDDEQGPPPEGGETMFDLANHFENRAKATDHDNSNYHDDGHGLIDG